MVCVQAAGCAPIVSAFERGADTAEPWVDAHTRAWGLRVPRAVGDALMLRALRESAGTAVAVEEEALHADALLMAQREGVDASPEGGACVTAVRRLLERGWLSRDEEIVVFNTGAGTKYVETLPELPTATITPER
jgi:threonine synthase